MYSPHNSTWLPASSSLPGSFLSIPLTSCHPYQHLQSAARTQTRSMPRSLLCSSAVWLSSSYSQFSTHMTFGWEEAPEAPAISAWSLMFPTGRNNASPPLPPTDRVPRTCWHLAHFDSRYNSNQKTWFIHKRGHYSAIKKEQNWVICRDVDGHTEWCSQKNKYHILRHICRT